MVVFCFCDWAHAIPVEAITRREEDNFGQGAVGELDGPESSETRSREAVSRLHNRLARQGLASLRLGLRPLRLEPLYGPAGASALIQSMA